MAWSLRTLKYGDMNQLSLTRINAKAPYRVVASQEANVFPFISESGVKFAICFDESIMLTTIDTYELTIANANNRPSPRDVNMRETIACIVEEFFRVNELGLLYICETGDNKQSMRNRLFTAWFDYFNQKNEYEIISESLQDDEGIENFAALILRKDNPNFDAYIKEFCSTADFFKDKPSYE